MLQSIRSQGVGHDFSTETTIKTADGIQEQRPELLRPRKPRGSGEYGRVLSKTIA